MMRWVCLNMLGNKPRTIGYSPTILGEMVGISLNRTTKWVCLKIMRQTTHLIVWQPYFSLSRIAIWGKASIFSPFRSWSEHIRSKDLVMCYTRHKLSLSHHLQSHHGPLISLPVIVGARVAHFRDDPGGFFRDDLNVNVFTLRCYQTWLGKSRENPPFVDFPAMFDETGG